MRIFVNLLLCIIEILYIMIEIVFVLSICIFTLRIILFLIGSFIESRKAIPELRIEELPFVSVIIPARNEESKIEQCILSISKNNYPIDKYEIIAINDRSIDDTGALLDELCKTIPNLKVIHNDSSKALRNLQGKPGALQLAINNSFGEIFIMTDADCTVSQNWLITHARCYKDKKLGLTAAYTNTNGDTLFSKIQAVEWLYMHTMAIGGIGLKIPLSCYGNNMSVSRKSFDELGGYENIKFSITEDLALLHATYNSGWHVRHLSNVDSSITTLPNRNFKEYLSQHHRWAVGAMALGWKAFFYVLSFVPMWIGLVLSVIVGDYCWFGIILGSRIILDSVLSIPVMFRLKRTDLLIYLVPAIFFMMSIELIAPFFLLKRNISWKGQVFKDDIKANQ